MASLPAGASLKMLQIPSQFGARRLATSLMSHVLLAMRSLEGLTAGAYSQLDKSDSTPPACSKELCVVFVLTYDFGSKSLTGCT